MKDRILVGVPTRGRPAYLSGLLATLMYQSNSDWDLLIVDTSEGGNIGKDPQVKRFLDVIWVRSQVTILHLPAAGYSEVVAVNRIMVEAYNQGYGFVYKVDDDHTVPPDTLSSLKKLVEQQGNEGSPVLASGVTPWMFSPWEGASGPGDIQEYSELKDQECLSYMIERDHELVTHIGHFVRWSNVDLAVKRTMLASAANFMLRPDPRILWSDIGTSSMSADAVWFLQLQNLLGYRLYFNLLIHVWHVSAPHGGVRVIPGNHIKKSEEDALRQPLLKEHVREFWRTHEKMD